MAQPEKMTKDSKYKKVMEGLDVWTAFYRANPVRFLIDYFQYQFVCPAFLELVFQMIASVDQFTVQVPLDGEKFVYVPDVR